MKILILKPSSLGDVVQALPVLRLIKLHYPESRIYWWIDSRLAPLLHGDRDLEDVVLFERHRWAAPKNWRAFVASVVWMRAQHFDWVIDLQCLARSGAVAWLSNGNLLVGLDEPREGARGYYDLCVRRGGYHTHAVDWYVSVLPPLGVPVRRTFDWLPARPTVAHALRRKWPLDDARWILLQPGARWLNKRWPLEQYIALVRAALPRFPDFRFAILGGDADRPLGADIAAVDPRRCLDLTGRLSLTEMVEWIRAGEVIVTNDTGPMHVAAALGKKIVALFGPTEPRRTGPYRQLHHVVKTELPCSPCMKSRCRWPQQLECLHRLTPQIVLRAIEQRLSFPSS